MEERAVEQADESGKQKDKHWPLRYVLRVWNFSVQFHCSKCRRVEVFLEFF